MTTTTHDTTSPTREEVFRCLCELGLDNVEYEDAEAILALFAPALAAAEKRGMEKAKTIAVHAAEKQLFRFAPPSTSRQEEDITLTQAVTREIVRDIETAIRAEMEKM